MSDTAKSVVLTSEGLYLQLPIGVRAIIAHYENRVVEVDAQIALYILRGLVHALTDKPEFATVVSRIRKVIKEGPQSAIQNTMLEIFEVVRTDFSQIPLEEVQDVLTRLQHGAMAEADQKAQIASQYAIIAGRLIDPANYILFRHVLADSQIQTSFDENLLSFARRLTNYMPGVEALMESTAFALKTVVEKAKAVREWFDQEHSEWQKITVINLYGYRGSRLTQLAWEIMAIFKRMTHLKYLFLEMNELTTLPEVIGVLVGLEALDLSNNQLKTLPDTTGNLTQLKRLNISYNPLIIIPDILGSLVGLESLDLKSTQLTTLSDAIGKLTQLEFLNLDKNQLTTLPDAIGNLTRLKALYLSDNRLTALPNAIGCLIQLQRLYLSQNQLRTLPDTIGNLTQLKVLGLSRILTNLPDNYLTFFSLDKFDRLRRNEILPTTLPASLATIIGLKSWITGDAEGLFYQGIPIEKNIKDVINCCGIC